MKDTFIQSIDSLDEQTQVRLSAFFLAASFRKYDIEQESMAIDQQDQIREALEAGPSLTDSEREELEFMYDSNRQLIKANNQAISDYLGVMAVNYRNLPDHLREEIDMGDFINCTEESEAIANNVIARLSDRITDEAIQLNEKIIQKRNYNHDRKRSKNLEMAPA